MSPFFSSDEPRTIGEIVNIYIEQLLYKWFKFFDIPIETLPYAVVLALTKVEERIGERYYAPANGIDPLWEAEDDAYDDELLNIFDLLDKSPVTFERLVDAAYKIVGFDSFFEYFCQPDTAFSENERPDRQEQDDADDESDCSTT